jgi:hypothetical protein
MCHLRRLLHVVMKRLGGEEAADVELGESRLESRERPKHQLDEPRFVVARPRWGHNLWSVRS